MKNNLTPGARNEKWHSKHILSENATTEQKIKWHMEHARRCSCSVYDKSIIKELKKRYSGKHQDFWIFHNASDHRALGLWAAECAERLQPYFEKKYPKDKRPREAINTLRIWAKTGEFNMSVIRKVSLNAHAAAKSVSTKDKDAQYAAHAAGQAAGTAHVPTHAFGTILYSIKLIACLNPTNIKASVARERKWQTSRLQKDLRPWAGSWMQKLQKLLPENIRTQLD